jgi:hypothetical protein
MSDDKQNLWNGKVLDELSKTELVNIGKELKIKNYSKLAKKLLIEEIKKVQLSQETNETSKDEKDSSDKSLNTDREEELSNLQRIDLIELAKGLKIKNYSRLSKSDLIKEIISFDISKDAEIVHNSNIETTTEEIVITPKKDQYGNLEELDLKELVEIGKELKIKNYSRLSKKRLIKSISELLDPELSASEVLDSKVEEVKAEPIKLVEKTEDTKEEVLDKKETLEEKSEEIKKLESKDDAKSLTTKEEEIKDENKEKTIDKKDSTLEDEELKVKLSNSEKELTELEKIEVSHFHLKEEKTSKDEAKEEEETKLSTEEQMRLRFLMSPSKFPFSKTNEEYLLKEEEEITLADLTFEEDKIVLLPIDPYRSFTYWDLSTSTITKLRTLRLKNLYLKINDVTGIVFNGNNENSSWFEECLVLSKNWYINIPEGGRNYCVELGYIFNGLFYPLVRSNTINIPRRDPSPIIKDTFVIVNYPEVKTKTAKKDTGSSSTIFISRKPEPKQTNYYDLNDFNIMENYNLKRLPQKMPVFTLNENLQDHFIQEYDISGKKEDEKTFVSVKLPEKLAGEPPEYIIPEVLEPIDFQDDNRKNDFEEQYKDFDISEAFNFDKPIPSFSVPNFDLDQPKEEPIYNNNQSNNQLESDNFVASEYFVENFDMNFEPQRITNSYYYELPSQESGKTIKVYYEWFENDVPYKKVIYWVSDPTPVIHEKLYKISWGPTWIKEFIGGSERLKYLGASERFLGSSDIYLGGSEMFIESSGRYPLMGEEVITPSGYPGGSEMFIESSYRYPQGSEALISIGASENSFNFSNSQQIISGLGSGSRFRKWFE